MGGHCFNPWLDQYSFHGLSHYQATNLDSSILKEFADDNFKFDENGRKVSKRVENTGGKGKIARYEQFLLFPQCFQKACFPGAFKSVNVWEWVNGCECDRIHSSLTIVHCFGYVGKQLVAWKDRIDDLATTIYSITCIQRPPKGRNKSGLLQQVVFKCRLY